MGLGPCWTSEDHLLAVQVPDATDATNDRQPPPLTAPLLTLPNGALKWHPMPTQMLADVLPVAAVQPPRWLIAWNGDTPASRPTAALAQSEIDPEDYQAWLLTTLPSGSHVHRIRATVTAYCPCEICCVHRTEITADGRSTVEFPYGIATDWRQLPQGTQAHVPGYLTESAIGGVWSVDDTGAALRRSRDNGAELHIDVRFQSHWWATRWGVRHQWIYLVDPPATTGSLASAAR
jgi:hypothetical protein